MKIGILVSGLALLAIGYILMKIGGNASDRPEGASFLGLTIDPGTLFYLSLLGSFIFLLGILLAIAGAIIMAMTKENKEKEES